MRGKIEAQKRSFYPPIKRCNFLLLHEDLGIPKRNTLLTTMELRRNRTVKRKWKAAVQAMKKAASVKRRYRIYCGNISRVQTRVRT